MIPQTIHKRKTCYQQATACLTSIKKHTITTLKVVAVTGLCLGLFLPGYLEKLPPPQRPPLRIISIPRTCIRAVETFPPYTALFMLPGLQLARMGTTACNIQTPLEANSICERICNILLEQLEKNREFTRFQGDELIRDKGYSGSNFTVNGILRTLHFRIPVRFFDNYKKCLTYIHQMVFHNIRAFREGPQQIISLLKKIHTILLTGTVDESTRRPGEYRKTPRIHCAGLNAQEIEELAKKTLTDEEFAIFTAKAQMLPNGLSKQPIGDEEKGIWEKVTHVTCPPEEVEQQLISFAEELILRIENRTNVEELMSYAHTQIAKISPFESKNLQVARLFMHSLGIYFGNIYPVIIYDRTEYLMKVLQSMKSERVFTDYLTKNLLPWTCSQLETLNKIVPN